MRINDILTYFNFIASSNMYSGVYSLAFASNDSDTHNNNKDFCSKMV